MRPLLTSLPSCFSYLCTSTPLLRARVSPEPVQKTVVSSMLLLWVTWLAAGFAAGIGVAGCDASLESQSRNAIHMSVVKKKKKKKKNRENKIKNKKCPYMVACILCSPSKTDRPLCFVHVHMHRVCVCTCIIRVGSRAVQLINTTW